MLGCCGQIFRRQRRLSEKLSNAFSKREETSLIHGVRRHVRLVAWFRKLVVCGQNGSERLFRSLCGRTRFSLARSAAFWTGFERSARLAEKTSLMQQISHNRPAADKGNISVARYRFRVNTVSQARMYLYKLYSLLLDWQRVPADMTVNSFFWPWVTVRNCFQN